MDLESSLGYVPLEEVVSCELGNSYNTCPTAFTTTNKLSCIQFPEIDWIYFKGLTTSSIAFNNDIIYIKNLRIPLYVDTLDLANTFETYIMDSNQIIQNQNKIFNYVSTVLTISELDMLEAWIEIPNKAAAYRSATYTFNFRATTDIPNGGKVVLTFPT